MSNTQTWSAKDYAENGRFVATLAGPVVALLAPKAGERILDVGCGDGALTEVLVRMGATVVGVDTSAELLGAAKKLGLDVRLEDAQNLPFQAEFDAVFTNAVLHWMTDLGAALRGMRAALRRGGRIAGEFGGFGNTAAICSALVAAARRRDLRLRFPWTFPTVEEFRTLLAESGFEPEVVELIPRPTSLPSGMEAWLGTFAKSIMHQFPESERKAALSEVIESLRWSLQDRNGNWFGDYVRLRFRAKTLDSHR